MSDSKRKRDEYDGSLKSARTAAKRNNIKREDEFDLDAMLDEMYADEEAFVFIHEKESDDE